MKLGIGQNMVIMNEPTLRNILNKHFQYDTDQLITEVVQDENEDFVVVFNDKPVAEEAEKGEG